jgi:hypothetical protein
LKDYDAALINDRDIKPNEGVRQLLREKVKETRTPFSGPIYYDDRGWRLGRARFPPPANKSGSC